jgi:asparagine synthase (glutamine-hydrolysing)
MASYEDKSSLQVLRDLLERRRSSRRFRSDLALDPAYGVDAARDEKIRAVMSEPGRERSRVWRLLHRDVRWGNVPIVLGYTDRVSMAHSIEARVPFLDLGLVEMAFALPDEFKVGHGQRKRILRDVARRYLPPVVTERKDRMGFAIPEAMLLREIWRDVAARLRSVAAFPAFPPGTVEGLLARFEVGEIGVIRAVWRVYALSRWIEEFDLAT